MNFQLNTRQVYRQSVVAGPLWCIREPDSPKEELRSVLRCSRGTFLFRSTFGSELSINLGRFTFEATMYTALVPCSLPVNSALLLLLLHSAHFQSSFTFSIEEPSISLYGLLKNVTRFSPEERIPLCSKLFHNGPRYSRDLDEKNKMATLRPTLKSTETVCKCNRAKPLLDINRRICCTLHSKSTKELEELFYIYLYQWKFHLNNLISYM